MKTINPHDFNQKVQEKNTKEIFIDVRDPDEFRFARISGTTNIPLEKLPERINELKTFDTVYVHCQSGGRGEKACQILDEAGFNTHVNLEGGLDAWQQHALPVEGGRRLPIMRQVFVVVATILAFASLLIVFVSVKWVALVVLIACGLMYSGISGNCAMSKALMKMPWNR